MSSQHPIDSPAEAASRQAWVDRQHMFRHIEQEPAPRIRTVRWSSITALVLVVALLCVAVWAHRAGQQGDATRILPLREAVR